VDRTELMQGFSEDSTGTDHAWMRTASCRGRPPSDFFPSDGVGVERAKKLCVQCEVRLECLEYALSYRIDHGVWGGCSERERRRILRRRRLTLAGITG
jgi:WhiB family transcriptional regulator, redox-sensing transcriptional regulator